MATENSAVKCPSCGASVRLPEGRDKGYCAYCGTLVTAEKANEKVVRHVDEAKLRHEEAAAAVRLKELEMEERRRELEERRRPKKTFIKIVLVLVMLICFFVGYSSLGNGEDSYGPTMGFLMVGTVCAYVLVAMMVSDSNRNENLTDKGGSVEDDDDDWDDED